MHPTEQIAKAVKFHRKIASLTQQELALLAGVGKTAVFDIEKGKKTVRLSTLYAVLDALNIRLHLESPLKQRADHAKS